MCLLEALKLGSTRPDRSRLWMTRDITHRRSGMSLSKQTASLTHIQAHPLHPHLYTHHLTYFRLSCRFWLFLGALHALTVMSMERCNKTTICEVKRWRWVKENGFLMRQLMTVEWTKMHLQTRMGYTRRR